MINPTLRRGVIVVLLVACAGCGDAGPTAPTAASHPSAVRPPIPAPPTTTAPATTFPPLSGPSRVFAFDRELSYRVSDYTRKSRLVLYDNGAFVLQYPSLGELGYRGKHKDDNGALAFEWEGWSSAGPWGATGTFDGDSLTVRYNLIMQMTDFEDAIYTLVR